MHSYSMQLGGRTLTIEAGKIAKIGSKIQRVAAPLGKIFTLMGLSAAASVITKPVNQ